MVILIISRSNLALDYVGSKTSSLGQMIKNCVNSRGHNFDPKFIKICQSVNPNKI